MTVLERKQESVPINLTEGVAQSAAAFWAVRERRHIAVVPNINVFSWESDLVTVTETRLSHEFEIKISRSDWLSERRRVDADGLTDPKARRARTLASPMAKLSVHSNIEKPSYYWLVMPDGVDIDGEIPDYAGVMRLQWWSDRWWVNCERRAPRLHREKVCDRTLSWMMRGMALRMYGK